MNKWLVLLFCSTLPSQAEIELLPAFPRDKLNLHKLLGSGAFGEVYEGTAVDILADGSGESKVAVKVTTAVYFSGNRMAWAERSVSEVLPEKWVLGWYGYFLPQFLANLLKISLVMISENSVYLRPHLCLIALFKCHVITVMMKCYHTYAFCWVDFEEGCHRPGEEWILEGGTLNEVRTALSLGTPQSWYPLRVVAFQKHKSSVFPLTDYCDIFGCSRVSAKQVTHYWWASWS